MTELVLYSDFVCPYCYLAEHGPLRRLQEEYGLALTWRGFELHPYIPKGGATLSQMFQPARAKMMREQLLRFANSLNVSIVVPDRVNNTQAALAMSQYADDHDALDVFRAEAMTAYWRDGADLESPEMWAELGRRSGLDPVEIVDAATAPEYMERVQSNREEAMDRGVMGIPTVFINDAPIIGCQPYETYVLEAKRFGALPE